MHLVVFDGFYEECVSGFLIIISEENDYRVRAYFNEQNKTEHKLI